MNQTTTNQPWMLACFVLAIQYSTTITRIVVVCAHYIGNVRLGATRRHLCSLTYSEVWSSFPFFHGKPLLNCLSAVWKCINWARISSKSMWIVTSRCSFPILGSCSPTFTIREATVPIKRSDRFESLMECHISAGFWSNKSLWLLHHPLLGIMHNILYGGLKYLRWFDRFELLSVAWSE